MRNIFVFFAVLLTGCLSPYSIYSNQGLGYGYGNTNQISVVNEHQVEQAPTLNPVYNCERYPSGSFERKECMDHTKLDNAWKRNEQSKSNEVKFRVYEGSANPSQNQSQNYGYENAMNPCGPRRIFMGYRFSGFPICRYVRTRYRGSYYHGWGGYTPSPIDMMIYQGW